LKYGGQKRKSAISVAIIFGLVNNQSSKHFGQYSFYSEVTLPEQHASSFTFNEAKKLLVETTEVQGNTTS
jgi:hypothetical protein